MEVKREAVSTQNPHFTAKELQEDLSISECFAALFPLRANY